MGRKASRMAFRLNVSRFRGRAVRDWMVETMTSILDVSGVTFLFFFLSSSGRAHVLHVKTVLTFFIYLSVGAYMALKDKTNYRGSGQCTICTASYGYLLVIILLYFNWFMILSWFLKPSHMMSRCSYSFQRKLKKTFFELFLYERRTPSFLPKCLNPGDEPITHKRVRHVSRFYILVVLVYITIIDDKTFG